MKTDRQADRKKNSHMKKMQMKKDAHISAIHVTASSSNCLPRLDSTLMEEDRMRKEAGAERRGSK